MLSCNTRFEIRPFALLPTINHSSSIFDLVVMYSHNQSYMNFGFVPSLSYLRMLVFVCVFVFQYMCLCVYVCVCKCSCLSLFLFIRIFMWQVFQCLVRIRQQHLNFWCFRGYIESPVHETSYSITEYAIERKVAVNPLSANSAKWSNTLWL